MLREPAAESIVGIRGWRGFDLAIQIGRARANGGTDGQDTSVPPLPSQSTINEETGVASGVNGLLHGKKSAVVVARPHFCGFARAASGPPLKCNFKLLNGSCGFSLNAAVN